MALVLPSGYYGYLVDNTANKTIDAVISTTAPKTVIWRGNLSSDSSGQSHLIVPFMCVLTGVLLSLTGLALGFQAEE